MSILQEIGATNFLSYKNLVLDLTKHPLTQLVGANGAGKTNLVSVLTEALYGKNPRGYTKGELVNRNNPNLPFEIYVKFLDKGDKYVASTTRKKDKAEVSLTKNGISITAHTSKGTFQLIEQILGMDYELFMQYVYQSSKFSTEFLTATPATRKAFLSKMLDLEPINADILAVSDFIKSTTSAVSALNTEITSINNTLKTVIYLESLPKVFEKAEILSNLTQQLDEARVQARMVAQNNLKKMEYIVNVKNRESTILSLLANEPKAPPELVLEKIEYDSKPYTTLLQSITSAEALFKSESAKCNILKKEHTVLLTSIPKTECDKCGHALDNTLSVEVHNSTIEKVYNSYVVQNGICAEYADQLQEMQKQKQALGFEYNKFKAYEDKVSQYNNNLVRYTNAKIVWDDKLTWARHELVLAQKELDNLIDLQLQIVDIPSLEEQISALNSEKANIELNNRIGKVFIESTNRIAELRSDLANKTYVLDNANILVKALKLVLTKTIENGLKNLQHKINVYLRAFGGDISIIFEANEAKLDISVVVKNVPVSYYTLSTGQAARVSISTLLAMREVLNTRSSKNINFLMLDEVVGTLDSEGKEQLIDILNDLKGMHIYLVSHDYENPLLEKLQVIKDKNGDTTYG